MNGAKSTAHSKLFPPSVEKSNLASRLLVNPVGPPVMAVSRDTTVSVRVGPLFPEGSVARTDIVWTPSLRLRV